MRHKVIIYASDNVTARTIAAVGCRYASVVLRLDHAAHNVRRCSEGAPVLASLFSVAAAKQKH